MKNIHEVDAEMAKCKDDPLAMQYWSGYRAALLEHGSQDALSTNQPGSGSNDPRIDATPLLTVRNKDAVVEAVCDDLRGRSEVGIRKYGVTLERKDLTLEQWLRHAYEENLDFANYLKRSLMQMRGEL